MQVSHGRDTVRAKTLKQLIGVPLRLLRRDHPQAYGSWPDYWTTVISSDNGSAQNEGEDLKHALIELFR